MSGLIKVFISHQTTNDKEVDMIYDALEKNNIKCWADHRDELVMHDWAGEIPPAIKESNLFIFLFSHESNNSDQCMREINYAINYCHIPVFVIKLDNLDFNDSFAYNFSKDNYLIAFDGVENHICEIVQSVIEFRNDPNRIRKNNIIFNTKTFMFATKQYYIDKKHIDPSSDEENIIDSLLPTVSNSENKYNYKKLLNIIKYQNIALIGQQGVDLSIFV